MSHKARRFDLSPDNFIGGVSGVLTASELGIYWAICLLIYSTGGPIIYDEMRLKSFLRGTHLKEIKYALSRLETLGKIERNGIYLMAKGCLKPIEDASNRVLKAIENGSKGGRPVINNKDLEKPPAFEDKNPISTTITTTTTISKISKKEEATDVALPEWINLEAWSSFLEMRLKKRAPVTNRALKSLIAKLDKWRLAGHDPTEIIDKSVTNAWADFYEPNGGHNGRSQPRKTAHQKFIEGAYLAIHETATGVAGNGRGDFDEVGTPLLETRFRAESD